MVRFLVMHVAILASLFSAGLGLKRLGHPSGGALLHDEKLGKSGIGDWGFLLSGRDMDVSPGDDFYHYTNGKSIKTMKIPADQSSWGSFSALSLQSEKDVRAILEESAKAGHQMGRLYSSYLNETRCDELGFDPLLPALKKVKSLKTASDFAAMAGAGASSFMPSPISFGVMQDTKKPDTYCLGIDAGGLGLPDRDYYLESSFAPVKKAYGKYLSELLELIGWPSPSHASKHVVALEEEIAKVHWPSSEMRDPVKTYNPMDISELKATAPGFDWDALLDASGPYPKETKMVIGATSAVTGIAEIINETDISILRSWSAAHLVAAVAMKLSEPFRNTSFEFSRSLSGAAELPARWKRAASFVNQEMGDAVGKEYVKQHFPPSSKSTVESLTLAVKDAFETRLLSLDWMTNATKKRALKKLDAFEIQVGYPTKFRDYSGLHIDAGDLFGNAERLNTFAWNISLHKLGHLVDRAEWSMPPQTVNAYNDPAKNIVVFPAAILQPPFFDPNADMAVNFGGIGAVIGHEMTHGFDDQGRQYDYSGRLKDWWTDEDATEFIKRSAEYGQQFAEFDQDIPKGHHINPNLTMGETIADLGGITLALEAYRQYAQNSSSALRPPFSGEGPDDLEGDRRVLLAFAQVWADKTRPEALIQQITSDPHPPGNARVNVPLCNLDAWYDAFNITHGEMSREASKRVRIW